MTEISGQDGTNGTRFTLLHEAKIITKKNKQNIWQDSLRMEIKVV